MKSNRKKSRWLLALVLVFVLVVSFVGFSYAENGNDTLEAAEAAAAELAAQTGEVAEDAVLYAAAATAGDVFTLGEGEDAVDYDLTDADSAQEYVDGYADNLEADSAFESHIATAIAKVRETNKHYATILSLLPPIIAIVLALITKEVYSSLILGIIAGGIIYAGLNFEGIMNHVVQDGFIANVADSYNIGIIIFLVILGALVAMMNKAGGSAAFGRWAVKHIKSRVGAQLATIALGVLIFIDDYFNCLTVGSVMRPVTDSHNVSRAKLAYLIDATAAPVCIIAPISSWAAAVAGFARGAGADSGMSLFINAIPYNFYALLTIVMMLFLAISKFDYGPMKKHERNALEAGDLFTSGTKQAVEAMEVNEKGRVIDLVLPVVILIISCVIGMIYSGGFFDGASFVDAFSDSDASVGLALGAAFTFVITVIYFICRRVLKFKDIMESLPEGFKAMVPAILILVCAWTLKAMTDSLGAKIFISQLIEGSAGAFEKFLPAIIFLIAVGLSFATGTSWGTFGILIPIVLSVFKAGDPITIVAISACMAGAVCGDHCSPISDTTIMASAGAQCDHINHVSTQLPYALTVAGVSAVAYIIAGFVSNWVIVLPIAIVLMIATLFVVKALTAKKA
ncbi:MAG: Na+/H+ antiporter NhaC family protein [Clostridia bacterium]|nr:Na+/H+ antiporter NhaC family protein [Clostridia bacterium]